MKLGRKPIQNPVASYLTEFMSRKELTKEQLCVASGIKYHALDNIWKRRKVSYATLALLKACGAITAAIEKEYLKWIALHPQKKVIIK